MTNHWNEVFLIQYQQALLTEKRPEGIKFIKEQIKLLTNATANKNS